MPRGSLVRLNYGIGRELLEAPYDALRAFQINLRAQELVAFVYAEEAIMGDDAERAGGHLLFFASRCRGVKKIRVSRVHPILHGVIKRKRKRKFWDRAEVKTEPPGLEKTPTKSIHGARVTRPSQKMGLPNTFAEKHIGPESRQSVQGNSGKNEMWSVGRSGMSHARAVSLSTRPRIPSWPPADRAWQSPP
jgi:hypothetical protein